MSFIKARASDWHPDRPSVRPGLWIGALVGAVVLAVLVMGTVGHLLNGNGSPFLS